MHHCRLRSAAFAHGIDTLTRQRVVVPKSYSLGATCIPSSHRISEIPFRPPTTRAAPSILVARVVSISLFAHILVTPESFCGRLVDRGDERDEVLPTGTCLDGSLSLGRLPPLPLPALSSFRRRHQ